MSRAKRKISSSLESCLLAAAAVSHAVVPLLSDSALMSELPLSLLPHILAPLLQLSTSRRVQFLSGSRARSVLVYKCLDAVYMIGLRIGEEMARIHLTPLAIGLFSAFDKVDEDPCQDEKSALLQLKEVLTPSLAFSSFLCFHQLLGGTKLETSLANISFVKQMLRRHSVSMVRPGHRPCSWLELRGLGQQSSDQLSSGSGQSGNMIVVSQDSAEDSQDLNMIIKPAVNSGRHLKGELSHVSLECFE